MTIQRVRCTTCGEHRLRPDHCCSSCKSTAFEAITPTEGDIRTLELEVMGVAQEIDTIFFANGEVVPTSAPALRLAAACKALRLAREGVLIR